MTNESAVRAPGPHANRRGRRLSSANPTTTNDRRKPTAKNHPPSQQPTANSQQRRPNCLSAPWLSDAERSRLRRFAAGVRRIAGPDLEKICLYGSRARGEGHAESDLDVLVVVRRAARYRRRIRDLAGNLMDAEGWPLQGQLSQVVLSKTEWQFLLDRERLFAREVSAQGLPL